MLSQKIIQSARDVPPTDNWKLLHGRLSEDELREIIKNNPDVNWHRLSDYQTLSEDFIREFKDDVSWYWISVQQTLSEDFIREFKHYVHWHVIAVCQKLSPEFREEFQCYLTK